MSSNVATGHYGTLVFNPSERNHLPARIASVYKDRFDPEILSTIRDTPIEWLEIIAPNLLEYGFQHKAITRLVGQLEELNDMGEAESLNAEMRRLEPDNHPDYRQMVDRISLARDRAYGSQGKDSASRWVKDRIYTIFKGYRRYGYHLGNTTSNALIALLAYDRIGQGIFTQEDYDLLVKSWEAHLGKIILDDSPL